MADLEPRSAVARIDLAEEREFQLGRMLVRPNERAVLVDGERRELQPRVMKVLVALAKARPRVASRDSLIQQCWDGRIVGDDALNRCILALRHLADDIPPAPFAIETVPRIGHRLIETPSDQAVSPRATRKSRQKAFAGALLMLLVFAAALFLWQQGSTDAKPASIAVLPFRNLSGGDPYFAQGIGEEILGQLALEPQFRVAGSSSSSMLGEDVDARQAARRLNVEFILEGSVRRQGDRVQVNAGLVRGRDGIRLWSDSYDGKLDNIFTIQQQIGSSIAAALKRTLVQAPALSGPLVTKGEAYDLYLTARALIRTRNRRVGETAANLLRDAIRIDPAYAPAWASLAHATELQGALEDRDGYIAAVRRARGYARHAVRLAPDLGEGHRALGNMFGHGDPEGIAHLRRAAAVEPNNSENLLGLGNALSAGGEFERELAAYRAANRIDPLWFRTTGATAQAIAEMGNRSEAEAIARRGLPDKDANLDILLGRIAWILADYSEAARRWAIVARANSPRWSQTAERTLHEATHAVGVTSGQRIDVAFQISGRDNWRVWMDAAPAPALWLHRNRDPIAAAAYRKHNLVAAKLMLNAGRWRELVTTYDSAIGLQGIRPGRRLRVDQLGEAPVLALALRSAGRAEVADRMLNDAVAQTRRVYGLGTVPFWFDAQSATIFAVAGDKGKAISLLDHAFGRGWRQNSGADLRDISDEPALRSLHGNPRFERLRARLAAHYAREREEILRLRL